MRKTLLAAAGVLITSVVSHAAELRMQWQALGPDDRQIGTTPGQLLVLDTYVQMNAGDSLSYLAYSNEYEPSMSHLTTTPRSGWLDESTPGFLGDGSQQVVFTGPALFGPGEFLIGSQIIRLDEPGDGEDKRIMFHVEPQLQDASGAPYLFSPWPTAAVGWYSIGAGFPDTIICDPTSCPPDPLIVNVVHAYPDCNGNFILDSVDIGNGGSLDGDSDGIPDECQATLLFVNERAMGMNYGTSWTHAYADLRTAFNVAHSSGSNVTEIWVATGTYVPGTSRVAAFQLKSQLGVYGGFIGGELGRGQRKPSENVTVLSGDVARDDGLNFENTGENSFHVVTVVETDDTAVLDGFTITAGNANGTGYRFDRGGGLFSFSASPAVANCTFMGNRALENGGGMYAYRSQNWPFGTPPSLVNCRFLGNVAEYGGGLNNRVSPARLLNCVFIGNSASARGGAIHNEAGSHADFINCTITGNSAGINGGAMYTWGNTLPEIFNGVIWNNGPEAVLDNGNTTIAYSNIEGGWPGDGNIDAEPLFIDVDGPDDVFGTGDDNVRLSIGSPCIDKGDNDALPSSVITDIDGAERYRDGDFDGLVVIDMGAHEFPNFPDCNRNGIPDEDDIAGGSSLDCNGDGVPDDCQTDSDNDGIIDVCDVCPFDPLNDRDGDGVCVPEDGCPEDPEKIAPGQCGCGVRDDEDADGDGVPDCHDQCPGADDAIFAPECADAIPTVSGWGMAVLTLLLMVAGKVYFRYRRGSAVNPT